MKRTCLLACAVALVTLCSCTVKEQRLGYDDATGGVVLTALTDMPGVRTGVVDGGTEVFWESQEEIKVFAGTSSAKFVSANTDLASKADFIGPSDFSVAPGKPVVAVYPYSDDVAYDGECITMTLPSEQVACPGTFARGTNIAVAKSDTHTLQFRNVCGGLRFSVTEEGITKVIFEGLGGEMIAGKVQAAFDDAGLPVVKSVSNGSPFITLQAPEGQTLEVGKWYYIVALPGALESGYKLCFYKNDTYAKHESSSSNTIKRSVFGSVSLNSPLIFEDIDDGGQYSGVQDQGSSIELSEQEDALLYLPSEENSSFTEYTEEHLIQMDSIACKLLEMNGLMTKSSISNTNINNISGYIVEQLSWDSGDWGASHWAGNKITCLYDAEYNRSAEKVLTIVLKRDGRFQEGTAYLKLGTLNSGPVVCSVPISAGQEYVTMDVNIDRMIVTDGKGNAKITYLLPGYGILNLFPLIVYSNGYREYVNQVSIKSNPIVPADWDSKYHSLGDLLGTINGVEVRHNGNSVNDSGSMRYNISSGKHQCVELCSRYLKTMYSLSRTSSWGNANQWPKNRANDTMDSYIVLENDGSNRVREGDMIVFQYDDQSKYPYGHIGVVIKTVNDGTSNYISFAHQNGGNNSAQRPIGTTIQRSGDRVTKSSTRATTHFIRKDNVNEHPTSVRYEELEDDSAPMFRTSTDVLDFGSVEVGNYEVKRFVISNSGTAPLIISAIDVPDGFRCKYNSVTVNAGEDLEVPIRFDADIVKSYDGYCRIKTNAGTKRIKLNAEGVSGKIVIPEAIDLGLSVKWASCNVGASKPEEYGGYYQWAGITDVSNPSTYVDWTNCPYHTGDDPSYGWGKYVHSCYPYMWSGLGDPDNKTVLDPEDDVAHVKCGGKWRMPTSDEFKELHQNSDVEWTTLNGINCCKFTSKVNGNSIYLPAGNAWYEVGFGARGQFGYYWTSTLFPPISNPGSDDFAIFYELGSSYGTAGIARYNGLSVRPVYADKVSQPTISVSPTSLDFGEVSVGSSKGNEAGRVTMTNTGSSNLVISSFDCPSGFSHSPNLALPHTIAPGDSWTVTFAFRPTSAKQYSGYISINSNASNGSVKQVKVSGTGI